MKKKNNTILLDMDIVACPRPRVTRYATFYPKGYTNFKEEYAIKLNKLNIKQIPQPIPIEMNIEFYIKIPRSFSKKKKVEMEGTYVVKRPDIDNYIKSVLDGLNEIMFEDDSQVVKITATKKYINDDTGHFRISWKELR